MNWADCVLYARYRMSVTTERGRARGKPVGTNERELCTSEMPAWFAKNRYELPETIEFTWNAFIAGYAKYVEATKARQKSAAVAEQQTPTETQTPETASTP
jgi:hypothetical protein